MLEPTLNNLEPGNPIGRNRFISVLSHMSDPVMLIDRDMRITLSNESAQNTFGLKQSDLCFSSIGGTVDVCHGCPVVMSFEDGQSRKTEKVLTSMDGTKRYLDMAVTPLRSADGAINECIVVARDMTALKDLEQERKDMLSMLTHDLRTPLTVINFSVDHLLSNNCTDPDRIVLLERISAAVGNCTRLLEDFVMLSKFEAGLSRMRTSRMHLAMLISYSVGSLSHMLDEMGANIDVDIPEDLPDVMVDSSEMGRAIMNVLTNAVKHGRKGGNIKISAGRNDGLPAGVFVVVKDDGPGIPVESLPRVFEKYYRAPNASRTQGSGLGLAIVKKIVEMHGGRVGLDSREGYGTSVTITLPTAPSIH